MGLPLLLLGVSTAAAGCSGQCVGPGCESSWPAARLAVVRGVPDQREETVRAAAQGTWTGTLAEGAGWAATSIGPQILLGQPEADRVALLDDRTDTGSVSPVASWTGETSTSFGVSVAVIPASDGSGGYDLWVGAPQTEFAKGAAFLFRGANLDSGRTSASADVELVGGTAGDQLGTDVVLCADLTGDRQPELLVTSPWFATPAGGALEPVPALAGAVFLVRSQDLAKLDGRAEIWTVATTWYGAEPGEAAGRAVVCDRDLDGDGTVDVVIGAPWADGGDGRVYVVSGASLASGPLDQVASAVLPARAAEEGFGTSLATLAMGGQPMLVVGAAGYREGAGRVHVYPGRELESATPRRIASFEPDAGRVVPDHFGRAVDRADLDGDLLDDLVIGAPDYHGEGRDDFDTGRIWVWLGATSERWTLGLPADDADVVLTGKQPFERVGHGVAVSDLDADGVDELLVPTRAADPEAGR